MLPSNLLFLLVPVIAINAALITKRDQEETSEIQDCWEKCKRNPVDISFVVDSSGSIGQSNFTLGLGFIDDFIDIFDISPTGARVSLVTYGEVAYEEYAFGFRKYLDKESLKKAILGIPYHAGGSTNTSGGIRYMLQKHYPEARRNVNRIAIVITDGVSTNTLDTAAAASEAKAVYKEVFAIGIGSSLSSTPQELYQIASNREHVLNVDTYDRLQSIKKSLASITCNITTTDVCDAKPVDLSFVIDSSVSIGEDNFTLGMSFVRNIVSAFQINPSAVRVSAVTYGDRVYTEDAFNFDAYPTKEQVLNTLSKFTWRHGGKTETGDAINYMRTHQMNSARRTAAKVCIVLTDGQSQDREKTRKEAKKAQNENILMYAVGIGRVGSNQEYETELKRIAGNRARVIRSDNYAELSLIKNKLTILACQGILQALEVLAGGMTL